MDLVKDSCANLIKQGVDTRDLIEETIRYVAELSASELNESGFTLDPDDTYDALVEGIRSSAERAL